MKTYGYVTLEDVDNYLYNSYSMYDDLVCHFKVLSEKDKCAYLNSAADEFNDLVMQGSPVDSTQNLAFPRKGCFKPYLIPEEVKSAQIEEALALLKANISKHSDEQIKTMMSLGLMKNIKYNKREMGEVGLGDVVNSSVNKRQKLESKEAEKLLKPWIGG